MTAPATIDFDVFLSHATPDKPWVRTLRDSLESLGLKVYFDERELQPADNFVQALGEGLRQSRFILVVLTSESVARMWVIKEWTTFMAIHGPHGRIIPILKDSVALPDMMKTCQGIHALDGDAARVAVEVARRVGKVGALPPGDIRALGFAQDLVFHLRRDGAKLRIVAPDGISREAASPEANPEFDFHLRTFRRLSRRAVVRDDDRTELFDLARKLGNVLYGVLFNDDAIREALRLATVPNAPCPLLTLRADTDDLHALPWELLHDDHGFLIREGRLDLARSSVEQTSPGVTEPTKPFSLVVNVSAPQVTGEAQLHYEEESYRIVTAVADRCEMHPTELGTPADLLEMIQHHRPQGVHFSGHGAPGVLLFENEFGEPQPVSIHDLISQIRRLPGGQLPPFFYLANCHGNDPADDTAESCAARLHREGVDQVLGYQGPIVDLLSTRAEEAVYSALAGGQTTRHAVRLARNALELPLAEKDAAHRDSVKEAGTGENPLFPFAWAQLVYYQRGLDMPLGKVDNTKAVQPNAGLQRTYHAGDKRILQHGFIGRRREMHRIRRRQRAGGVAGRVFVFQGFGGLGKTTLQFRLPGLFGIDWEEVCILWCAEAEKYDDLLQALTRQLSDYGERRFGAAQWVLIIGQIDRMALDPLSRFQAFLQVLVQNSKRLMIVADNLESLLVGPQEATTSAVFGEWKSEALRSCWQALRQTAEQTPNLWLAASCRYQHPDFEDVLLEVSEMPADAVYRMMGWFAPLRRLTSATRRQLVHRLAGHPRAVEFTADLLHHQFERRRRRQGDWSLPEPPTPEDLQREWDEIVAPALPKMQERLWANLLFAELWENVLDERRRRMLYRMSLLRRPWTWEMVGLLGEENDPTETAESTFEELARTSLVLHEDHGTKAPKFSLHPATTVFVQQRMGEQTELKRAAHLRFGTYFEELAPQATYLEVYLEGGYHLFESGEYARAYELLGTASGILQNWGQVHLALDILHPFLVKHVEMRMDRIQFGTLLGRVGLGFHRLAQVNNAITFYERALAIAQEMMDRQNESTWLGNLGISYSNLGEIDKAIEYYEQALLISCELNDQRQQSNHLGNLGYVFSNTGQPRKAIEYYEQALALSRETMDRRNQANWLGNLGLAFRDLDQFEKAIDHHQQALEIFRELQDRRNEGNSLSNLGLAYLSLGQVEKGIEYHHAALDIARETKDRLGEGNRLGNLGLAFHSLGQLQKASKYYQQALQIAREIKSRGNECSWLGNLGLICSATCKFENAVKYFEEALLIAHDIRDLRDEGVWAGHLGVAYRAIGQSARAMTMLQRALQIGEKIQNHHIIQFATQKLKEMNGSAGSE